MTEGFLIMLCGDSNCSSDAVRECNSSFYGLISPFSCSNHILMISVDLLFLLVLASNLIYRFFSRKNVTLRTQRFSPLVCASAIFNGVLGFAYLGLGLWIIVDRLSTDQTILPLHEWLAMLFQGFTWLLLDLMVSLRKLQFNENALMKLCLTLIFLLSGFLCVVSLWEAIAEKTISVLLALNTLSCPGTVLFLFCVFRGRPCAGDNQEMNGSYEPLPGEEVNATDEIASKDDVTPFAKAGTLSQMSFWWLNPLMKQGKKKTLKDEDLPQMRQEDQARTCYLAFMERLRKSKRKGSSDSPSILSVIVSWHWKQILISGFFALIKVLCLSTGPLFLKAFIEIAEGNAAFAYEGYVLTAVLFVLKCLESLSERQWFFRARLIGIQVRSMLCSAVYRKQLRISTTGSVNHSPAQIVNYVTVDADRIGEFPYWCHQLWTTCLQLCLALAIVYLTVGLATFAALAGVTLVVLGSYPLIKMQHGCQENLMVTQDRRLRALSEALANIKILKLYAWETHFKNVVHGLRKEEFRWISDLLWHKGYLLVLFWSSPVLVPAITFWTCYFLGISLSADSVFTFLASLRLLQEPIRLLPEVFGVFIESKVSLDRISNFLEEPELQNRITRQKRGASELGQVISIRCSEISWDTEPSSKAALRNINFAMKTREKVAICGEVGSGKSTLLAAILGEVPKVDGIVHVNGKIAYVSQIAWIQTGTIQENILFGSAMDPVRYQEVLERCSLVKDLEMLPSRDLTLIGERGVNLSGGQKQRVQLARALYWDADVYLLDDPFSAVDAHTATSLFNEYVMGALSEKTVLLVTHQVDFLHAFNSILLLSSGEIIRAGTYDQLLASSQEFQDLVHAQNSTAGIEGQADHASRKKDTTSEEIQRVPSREKPDASMGDQLIKQEEREIGDVGFKPYIEYLSQSNGFLNFIAAIVVHLIFILGQLVQSYWLAADIQNSAVSRVILYGVYSSIGCVLAVLLLLRSYFVVLLGRGASESIFFTMMTSLFRAPMSFYDSTPLGRILSRVSSDLSIIDIEMAFKLSVTVGTTMNTYISFGVLCFLTWPVLLVIIPMVYLTVVLQRYYFASAKELLRINGTTKSSLASQLAESIAGAMTIRAFGEEDRFIEKNLDLIDRNAIPYFHYFSASEWLIQRLEILCAVVLSSCTLAITVLHLGASSSGFIGMEFAYGLSLNLFLVAMVQCQCQLANHSVSVERLEQYMHIPSEAPEVIDCNRPDPGWPAVGKVEIFNLQVRYSPNAPLVLRGITCTIEGGQKVGIVGRTGSGKTTLISALFRLVEPCGGMIVIDGVNISSIGLHDLRSHLGIIPQEPTLFSGSVRYNLDPLSEYSDQQIWEVLEKCHLQEAIQEKEQGLNSLVAQDGSNWSAGQRQLFCLGRALLKKSKILVLDEATASIDNATDATLQKTIRAEFASCTVITVAHRIPTVINCDMVLAISDGKLVEHDEPMKLMKNEGSLFGQLVKEYWFRTGGTNSHSGSDDW